MGKIDYSRRKSLLYRRGIGISAVSALVKPLAGTVQKNRNMIFKYAEPYLVQRTRFFKIAYTIIVFQPFHGGFFYYGLTVVNAVQLGIK